MFHDVPKSVITGGAANIGVFDQVPPDADLSGLRRGLLAPLRFKKWQHFLVQSPEVALTVAIIDLGFLRSAWVRVIPRPGVSFEVEARGAFTPCEVAANLRASTSFFSHRRLDIRVTHRDDANHQLRVVAADLDLDLELVGSSPPLAVVLPLPGGCVMYSQKRPLAGSGVLRLCGKETPLEPSSCTVLLDAHQGYYPHRTSWRWATASQGLASGGCLAFNMTSNQALEPAQNHECVLWVGDRAVRLAAAVFKVPQDPLQAWNIGSVDAAVSLRFDPIGLRQDNTRIGPLKSWYHQPWGVFSGTIHDSSGTCHVFSDVFGVCEDHAAHW